MNENTNTEVVELNAQHGIKAKLNIEYTTLPDAGVLAVLTCKRHGLTFSLRVTLHNTGAPIALRADLTDEDITDHYIVSKWTIEAPIFKAVFTDFDRFIKSCLIPAIEAGMYDIAHLHNEKPVLSDRAYAVFKAFGCKYDSIIKKYYDVHFEKPFSFANHYTAEQLEKWNLSVSDTQCV